MGEAQTLYSEMGHEKPDSLWSRVRFGEPFMAELGQKN